MRNNKNNRTNRGGKGNIDMKTLRRSLGMVLRYPSAAAASFGCALISVAAQLAAPILSGRAIDGMVYGGEPVTRSLIVILCLYGGSALIGAAAQWLMAVCNNRICCRLARDLRVSAMEKLQALPLSYLDNTRSGDIVSRMTADVDTFADGMLLCFTQLFTGVLTMAGTLVFMLAADWKTGLTVILLTPLSLLIAGFIARRNFRYFRAQSEARGALTAFSGELIAGSDVTGAFGHGEANIREFEALDSTLYDAGLKATFFGSLINPTTRFMNGIVYAGVALTGALSALTGGVTVGGLSCLLSYTNQYTKPFNEISGVIAELANALTCASRVYELIDAEPQTPDAHGAAVIVPDGSVSLRDVSFSYRPGVKLLEHLTLDVTAGKHIAIVGPTGCGKTTLINLLMRFYDVDSGAILLAGTDIRDATRASVRRSYGMVLQDTWLKAGTVAGNIAYGRPDAPRADIIAAAKMAHADSFIRRLPDGYDTLIGEDGGSLSQGQKQLLCIARVILCLPPILILDEATSSIDTLTELKIQKAFAAMTAGRTSFIVAHRLSTIRDADVILVMRDGNIVEQGSHAELLAKGGFYAKLYNSR